MAAEYKTKPKWGRMDTKSGVPWKRIYRCVYCYEFAQRRVTYARNVKTKPLRRVTTSLNGNSRDGINTRVKNDNDDDAYYLFYLFKQAIVPRFKRAEALCWKSVIAVGSPLSLCWKSVIKHRENRNGYAQMIPAIEYATDLHA